MLQELIYYKLLLARVNPATLLLRVKQQGNVIFMVFSPFPSFQSHGGQGSSLLSNLPAAARGWAGFSASFPGESSRNQEPWSLIPACHEPPEGQRGLKVAHPGVKPSWNQGWTVLSSLARGMEGEDAGMRMIPLSQNTEMPNLTRC